MVGLDERLSALQSAAPQAAAVKLIFALQQSGDLHYMQLLCIAFISCCRSTLRCVLFMCMLSASSLVIQLVLKCSGELSQQMICATACFGSCYAYNC